LYASPNIVRVIKSRTIRWTGTQHAWETREMHTIFWLENLKERIHLEDLGVSGKNIGMDLRVIAWEGVDLTQLTQDRAQWWAPVNTIIFWVP